MMAFKVTAAGGRGIVVTREDASDCNLTVFNTNSDGFQPIAIYKFAYTLIRYRQLAAEIRFQPFFYLQGIAALAKQEHHFGNSCLESHIVTIGYAYVFELLTGFITPQFYGTYLTL